MDCCHCCVGETVNDFSMYPTNVAETIRKLKCCDFYTSSDSWVAKRTLAPQNPWNGGASRRKMKKKGKQRKKGSNYTNCQSRYFAVGRE